MDKENYISKLYDNIKDDIAFDSDIVALEKLLTAMLKININKSIEWWKYIFNKYELKDLENDIDLTPLTKHFPLELIKKIDFPQFMDIIDKLNHNKELIYNNFFDVFDENCGIFQIISDLISQNLKEKEKEIIYLTINKESIYSESLFDSMQFLKKVIMLHLNEKNKNIQLLLEYTEIPNSLKDKSILKSLLIDYI